MSAGCGAAWLARRSGGPKVGGSNPLSPTKSLQFTVDSEHCPAVSALLMSYWLKIVSGAATSTPSPGCPGVE